MKTMTDKQHAAAAATFATRWADRGYEKGEGQKFWLELLGDVLGVEHPTSYIEFEDQVMLDNTSFIDGYIPSTRVLIEQKSLGKDLRKGIRQSDGSFLTPYQQAQRYIIGLPLSRHPRWVITCNFATLLIYDMERPNAEPEQIDIAHLEREWYRLRFLVDSSNNHLEREMRVSMRAGEIIGEVYDALLEQYGDRDTSTLRMLNILCVRLVFCLYAEDAGVFAHDQFHDYLARFDASMMRGALLQLFDTLNTPAERRSRYLAPELAAFPYTNGGLFAEPIDLPQFTPSLRDLLLKNASLDFDWSEISPTIFGAVFESTLNPETRRSGGMHYTSIENIHKVIDPLFLNELHSEFNTIAAEPVERTRRTRLLAFQDKLASLTFLDPACGSGNFLTETYLSLRRLENRVVSLLTGGRAVVGFDEFDPIKVSINQFYGIEVNDFAVTVATTALWISEAQMLAETERIIARDIDFLPLKSYSNVVEGNALRIDWASVVPPYTLDYIIGNPPFVGGMMMTKEQKQEFTDIFGKDIKGVGELDYVGAWYYKSAMLMTENNNIRAALVSTNSITQGEQVAILWKTLQQRFNISIDFAHRTFRWDSEATLKAHVHCVIIGFSIGDHGEHVIYTGERSVKAKYINAYLLEAPDIYIENRSKPLCDVPAMNFGNMPRDGGGFILSEDERNELIANEPLAAQWVHPFPGAYEFINNKKRYCLWLQGANPSELHRCPMVLKRVEAVRQMRLASKAASTRKMAETPTLFAQITQPLGKEFILVPSVSSERRRYIPMGFFDKDTIASNLVFVIPEATLYHFGVLESNVHMAWMRAVCGRLKSDYRYSKDVVYNNFPWPEVSDEQRQRIEATAQAILDARALYPDSSLADLYDELTMPVELRRAHQNNDRAVMAAYGFATSMTESECVAALFDRYRALT